MNTAHPSEAIRELVTLSWSLRANQSEKELFLLHPATTESRVLQTWKNCHSRDLAALRASWRVVHGFLSCVEDEKAWSLLEHNIKASAQKSK